MRFEIRNIYSIFNFDNGNICGIEVRTFLVNVDCGYRYRVYAMFCGYRHLTAIRVHWFNTQSDKLKGQLGYSWLPVSPLSLASASGLLASLIYDVQEDREQQTKFLGNLRESNKESGSIHFDLALGYSRKRLHRGAVRTQNFRGY